jgi:hypothetical protein
MSFAQSIIRHVSGKALMERLDEILKAEPRQKAEYTLERMVELVEPQDREELILALGDLVRNGRIKKLIRVISPKTRGGIGDFESLEAVPSVLTDSRTGLTMEVTPDDLCLIYVVPAQNDSR